MQGLYIWNDGDDGDQRWVRPKSKKQVRELVATPEGRERVTVDPTSAFGNEYGGLVSELPAGSHLTFVGPDPYIRRNFYGELIHTSDGRWTVK